MASLRARHERLEAATYVVQRWADGRKVIVAAPGPSLTPEVAARCQGHTVLAIKEAYRLLPWAEVLYNCDAKWWDANNGCPDFAGEKWSSHGSPRSDNKKPCAEKYGLHLVQGRTGVTFSENAEHINYGSNSGFQGINLAILFGALNIVLVGFDMREVDGKPYFFGKHPTRTRSNYGRFAHKFATAERHLPPYIKIVNATPGSALTCFPMMSLEDALNADPVAA